MATSTHFKHRGAQVELWSDQGFCQAGICFDSTQPIYGGILFLVFLLTILNSKNTDSFWADHSPSSSSPPPLLHSWVHSSARFPQPSGRSSPSPPRSSRWKSSRDPRRFGGRGGLVEPKKGEGGCHVAVKAMSLSFLRTFAHALGCIVSSVLKHMVT